ncbi:adaptin ear-binding coat-associated protein 1 NECAP-1 [Trichoderma citrinoviride]|uniref:Adaptin ear-binding coat-associated protein 1 NECAP-1 n=1 Tax=Trichoderma citrinoviride TaxID=58853 RepID=A0A2T4B6K4_9HYPO|nr:adaptin ear-binding coat-associated protein 1 NECAP-1 [Trichoderma citrinoviride]PTB64831.1 adaptin ear-binding coat-associated protein 1 NECAP-1 [Trichoderma citrinoviride]
MDPIDPTTGQPLPSDAIQRILFVAHPVHVYNIPPLTSMRGHSASSWTEDPARHIFTARLRVVETSFESTADSSSSSATSIKIDLVLEDPSTGALFAAAPYNDRAAVEPVVDSSRFFAVTVKDPQGRKAVLGIGFEERSDAFDLAVSLQEARRSLGWESEQAHNSSNPADAKANKTETKDYSLKEGETITVNLGGTKFGRRRPQNAQDESTSSSSSADLQSFALPPPPAGGFSLPPPPKTSDVKEKRKSLKNLGFDDGQFGEFA